MSERPGGRIFCLSLRPPDPRLKGRVAGGIDGCPALHGFCPRPTSEELAADFTEDLANGLGQIHGLSAAGRVTASAINKRGDYEQIT